MSYYSQLLSAPFYTISAFRQAHSICNCPFATPSISQNARTYLAGFPRFEDSHEMTIRWYLDNQAWLDNITSDACMPYHAEAGT